MTKKREVKDEGDTLSQCKISKRNLAVLKLLGKKGDSYNDIITTILRKLRIIDHKGKLHWEIEEIVDHAKIEALVKRGILISGGLCVDDKNVVKTLED
jgi:hypothetical protein